MFFINPTKLSNFPPKSLGIFSAGEERRWVLRKETVGISEMYKILRVGGVDYSCLINNYLHLFILGEKKEVFGGDGSVEREKEGKVYVKFARLLVKMLEEFILL